MSRFERYLTLWVALCIVAGVALGHALPALFQAIGPWKLPTSICRSAVLIWLMIIPMLVKIDFAALHQVKEHWRGIGVTLFVNWAVKPFSMALLGWLFVGYLFKSLLPPAQIDSLNCRSHHSGRGAVYRDGVRLEPADQGRATFHSVAGGPERCSDGLRIRADRRTPFGAIRHHSALANTAAVRRAVHRHSRRHRPSAATPGIGVWRPGQAELATRQVATRIPGCVAGD